MAMLNFVVDPKYGDDEKYRRSLDEINRLPVVASQPRYSDVYGQFAMNMPKAPTVADVPIETMDPQLTSALYKARADKVDAYRQDMEKQSLGRDNLRITSFAKQNNLSIPDAILGLASDNQLENTLPRLNDYAQHWAKAGDESRGASAMKEAPPLPIPDKDGNVQSFSGYSNALTQVFAKHNRPDMANKATDDARSYYEKAHLPTLQDVSVTAGKNTEKAKVAKDLFGNPEVVVKAESGAGDGGLTASQSADDKRQWHTAAKGTLQGFYGSMTDMGFVVNPERMKEYNTALAELEKFRVKGLDHNEAATIASRRAAWKAGNADTIGNRIRELAKKGIPEKDIARDLKAKGVDPANYGLME